MTTETETETIDDESPVCAHIHLELSGRWGTCLRKAEFVIHTATYRDGKIITIPSEDTYACETHVGALLGVTDEKIAQEAFWVVYPVGAVT